MTIKPRRYSRIIRCFYMRRSIGSRIKPDGVYMDCTLGGGGHSLEILKRLGDRGRLIAVDQDAEAIAASKKRLADYLDKIDFIHDNFENAVMRAKEIGYDGIDGAVIDLGVSSIPSSTRRRGASPT